MVMDVCFSVEYSTNWGQNVYVVGDLPQLGEWKESSAVKLSWTSGHIWTATIRLPAGVPFHYKYLVLGGGPARWESGPNRCATALDSPLENHWEHTIVTLALHVELSSPTQTVYVNGDSEGLGQWDARGPMPMHLATSVRTLPEGGEGLCWEYTFDQPRDQAVFRYRYVLIDSARDEVEWERGVARECSMEDLFEVPNSITRVDADFQVSFTPFKITDYQLFLGPYPQTENDIETLARAGITAIVNIQSRRDMTSRKLNWPKQQAIYSRLEMEATHVPMSESDRPGMLERLPHAAGIMDEMYGNGKTIYVHCTDGVEVAPTLIAYYLIRYNSFSVGSAVALVQESYPQAQILTEVLQEALG
jgi:protein-tyrosine phosphatase